MDHQEISPLSISPPSSIELTKQSSWKLSSGLSDLKSKDKDNSSSEKSKEMSGEKHKQDSLGVELDDGESQKDSTSFHSGD